MEKQKFDTIVKNLAAKNLNERIDIFIKKLRQAFYDLGFEKSENIYDSSCPENILLFLKDVVANERFDKSFPIYLWENEEVKVAQDILKQLNIVQQALMAPSADDIYKKP